MANLYPGDAPSLITDGIGQDTLPINVVDAAVVVRDGLVLLDCVIETQDDLDTVHFWLSNGQHFRATIEEIV